MITRSKIFEQIKAIDCGNTAFEKGNAQTALVVASAGSKASKIFTTVKTAVKTTAKNPQFWTSFVREVGTTYDTALSSGATSNQATTAALISSLINAYIEVGGGIEVCRARHTLAEEA